MNTALHLVHVVGERRWDELLPAAALAYRTTPNTSTGFSPFFLVTGTGTVLPLSREWDAPSFDSSGPAWLKTLWRCRHELMDKHNKELQRRQRLSKEDSYPIGSWVGIKAQTSEPRIEGSSSKFARKYLGPYRVIRVLPNGVTWVSLMAYARKSIAAI